MRAEAEDESVPTSWGLLLEEIGLFTCVTEAGWWALWAHSQVGASTAIGEPPQELSAALAAQHLGVRP